MVCHCFHFHWYRGWCWLVAPKFTAERGPENCINGFSRPDYPMIHITNIVSYWCCELLISHTRWKLWALPAHLLLVNAFILTASSTVGIWGMPTKFVKSDVCPADSRCPSISPHHDSFLYVQINHTPAVMSCITVVPLIMMRSRTPLQWPDGLNYQINFFT